MSPRAATRVAIVGGGISGLACGWSLSRAASAHGLRSPEIVLFEAGEEVGGKARTHDLGEWRVEAGPTGFLDNEPVLDSLVELAGLEKLPADEVAARRYLVRGGRLRELHAHPLRFAASGVLSPAGLLRLAGERVVPRRASSEDESVWDFACRRLGREAAQRLIAPMVLGVFAGDARALSLPSAFPRMAELEERHGSLFKALSRLRRERAEHGGPAGPSGRLTSFGGGLQALPTALAQRAPFEVRLATPVRGLAHDGAHWRLDAERGGGGFDAVVLAGESWSVAPLLSVVAPEAARELAAIETPGVAVVALGYGREALERAPRGFGALIPREEGLRLLGVLWDSHLFRGRSPDGTLLCRCMLGGATDPEAARLSEDELARIAHRELSDLLGLTTPPSLTHVVRWPRAIPQYTLGHAARVRRIEDELARVRDQRGSIHLAGNALHGVAFGRSARRGWEVGEAVALDLAQAGTSLSSS